VPQEVKLERLERLQAIQREVTRETLAAQVGQPVEVLVEGPSRFDALKRFGRTPENRTVNFTGSAPTGVRVVVRVTASSLSSLCGEEVGGRPEAWRLPAA
jgi:tRNA-2-methylthio-N6-dimethylallyladenosine synthase